MSPAIMDTRRGPEGVLYNESWLYGEKLRIVIYRFSQA